METFILAGSDTALLREAIGTIKAFSSARCLVVGPRPLWSRLRAKRVTYAGIGTGMADDSCFVDLVRPYTERMAYTRIVAVDADAIRMMYRVRESIAPGALPYPEPLQFLAFGDAERFAHLCVDLRLPVLRTLRIEDSEKAGFVETKALLRGRSA